MGIHVLVTNWHHLTNTFVVTATSENKLSVRQNTLWFPGNSVF